MNVTRSPTLLNLSLTSPEQNLALDEALLLACEDAWSQGKSSCEYLRLWESKTVFVVLGVAGKLREEVEWEACKKDDVPVLRRVSGGGTVVQGPGCLNFSLVLSSRNRPELGGIHESYAHILEQTVAGFATGGLGLKGTSDITIGGLKISGNAQKRTRHAVLHHGTLLYAFDSSVIARLLKEPEKQPDYREGRRHVDFVTNLGLSREVIEKGIAAAWEARDPDTPLTPPPLEDLIAQKYGNRSWNERF